MNFISCLPLNVINRWENKWNGCYNICTKAFIYNDLSTQRQLNKKEIITPRCLKWPWTQLIKKRSPPLLKGAKPMNSRHDYSFLLCESKNPHSAIEGAFIYLIQIQYSWLYPGHVHHLFNLVNGAWWQMKECLTINWLWHWLFTRKVLKNIFHLSNICWLNVKNLVTIKRLSVLFQVCSCIIVKSGVLGSDW